MEYYMQYITDRAIGAILTLVLLFEQHHKHLIFSQVWRPYGSGCNADEANRTAILFRDKKLHRKLM